MPDPFAQLLDRLGRDRLRLAGLAGGPLDRLVGHRAVGDPHEGGARVSVLRFASGARIVYKPRPVAPEGFWYRLTAWCNERAGRSLLAAPLVLECGEYGWATFLKPAAPRELGEWRRYYRRAGTLLALLDVFEVRDAHHENIVVSGGYPILVDAETVAHPRFAPFTESPSLALSGFLPAPGATTREAGIHAVRGRFAPVRFAADVVAGYREGYDLLRRHRRALLARGGPLDGIRGLRTRVILRPTRRYGEALRSGTWPLSDLGVLPFPAAVRRAVAAAERRALSAGDIPVFHARAGGRSLEPGGPAFALSGAGAILRRLRRLCVADREEMVHVIRGTLALDALAGNRRAAC